MTVSKIIDGYMTLTLTIGINITEETAFNEIKSILPQISYVECGNCVAIKIDAKKLAESLNSFLAMYYKNQNNDLNSELFSELVLDILNVLIEPEPEFEDIDDWEQWDKINICRRCDFLDDYESAMYIKYSEVVIYFDNSCGCFSKDKLKDNIKLIFNGNLWYVY
ncbi:MAG: hypothetical protein ACFFBZ_16325 [Promethearchaeota archaeon]